MTLIVGLANDEIGFLVGETILTPLLWIKGNPIGPVNGEFHGLKIQIINGDNAIAFASSNAVDAALRVISAVSEEISRCPSTDIFQKTKEFYSAQFSCDEKPDCEFLVLRLDGERKRLAHITASEIKFVERAYIGDQKQMAKLNDLRQPYVGPKQAHVQQPDGSFKIEPVKDSAGQIEFMEVSIALERLVEQRLQEGVGAIAGNIIRVANARLSGQLEYFQTVMAGISLEEGAIGYSLLASNTAKRGVGIYYIAGKLGFLMIVGDTETCRKVRAETLGEFKKIARDCWGLDLV